ncbi:NnrS family protein [Cellvibrio sp. QJXJ]|uniref:NnrS family protein n=1 Tax=Cellvibrio sp. QJXJ TaxID=2964606 RepID=UPI0021C3189F|nr:NnrS family protein [Cellvibrio sp. QJXJ]UUA72373.1 NnrS family protein [Cellvibrio sp. QJXJ]
MTNSSVSATFSYPFRVFFLATALYGIAVVIAWMSYLFGGIPLPLGWTSLHWHSHEMLYGFTSAAIAGFILTAVCNWTGAPPLKGGKLLALVGLWLAGRLSLWTASWLPAGTAMLIDGLFFPILALYLLQLLLRHGNQRNLVLVAILLLLGMGNLAMHWGFLTGKTAWLVQGEQLAFGLITLIMIVIGGRIIPAFSRNWLRQRGGNEGAVKSSNRTDAITLILSAAVIPVDVWLGSGTVAALVILAAAAANAWRLWSWSGWLTRAEPLLWILHLGYAWIIAGLLLKGMAALNLIAPSVWQHALGVGAMGTLILGVMTRVALGHTGRALTLPTFGVIIYLAISIAALSRVLAALGWINYSFGLMLAASGWTLAFALFLLLYWPILTRPRIG